MLEPTRAAMGKGSPTIFPLSAFMTKKTSVKRTVQALCGKVTCFRMKRNV
jgi:hypothetical protein